MPSPAVGLPFDWHLPPKGLSGHSMPHADEAQITGLHVAQLAPYSPYADVYKLWSQGQSLDWAANKLEAERPSLYVPPWSAGHNSARLTPRHLPPSCGTSTRPVAACIPQAACLCNRLVGSL